MRRRTSVRRNEREEKGDQISQNEQVSETVSRQEVLKVQHRSMRKNSSNDEALHLGGGACSAAGEVRRTWLTSTLLWRKTRTNDGEIRTKTGGLTEERRFREGTTIGTWGELRIYLISGSRMIDEVFSASTIIETFRKIKEGVDADVPVDAQNASTATWKTADSFVRPAKGWRVQREAVPPGQQPDAL
jgi:hypothetical protein